jgi:hypothetical protein
MDAQRFTGNVRRAVESGRIVNLIEKVINHRLLSLQNSFLVIFTLYLVYWLVVYIYRVTLHPLSKFPGPVLAGASFWYEFYYDVWPRKYRYMWKIEELHKKYGECKPQNYE